MLVLAVVIPCCVFRSSGDAKNGDQNVAANLKSGQSLFQTNCGTCHTLYAAGTDGNYAPNLDELLAPNGPPEGPTRQRRSRRPKAASSTRSKTASTAPPRAACPAASSTKQQAKEVAEFVAHTAGEG